MASKNQEYAAQYAECAMAQMRRYGIPASVILAQGILESSNGQSRLALAENNHFGIKATPEWIAQGAHPPTASTRTSGSCARPASQW